MTHLKLVLTMSMVVLLAEPALFFLSVVIILTDIWPRVWWMIKTFSCVIAFLIIESFSLFQAYKNLAPGHSWPQS